jgi:hypothetical protein
MKNLSMYCMALNNSNLDQIKDLNYIPVGLKNTEFSKDWLRDNTQENICEKNPYYGEYTFYYWYWKNLLKFKKENEWVGFCSYREYWGNNKNTENKNIKEIVLQEAHREWEDYETIIGKPISVGGTKLIKVLKYGKLALLMNPKAIFFKEGRTIKWQFDMFHGVGNLDKAIELLPEKDREEFRYFTRNETAFARGNIFITKSSKVIDLYFKEVFDWLLKCEAIFGFNLKSYGKIRMYTFLAERFLPFWFKKYTNYLEWPIVYHDINK